jgi:quercetin dioxygenase-like cupin family protein
VLEGTVVSQLEGEPATTYTKGQSWYEPPKKPHITARNASAGVPAKLLVVLISEPGEPLTVPKK